MAPLVELPVNFDNFVHDHEHDAMRALIARAQHYNLRAQISNADDVTTLGEWWQTNTIMHKLWNWREDFFAQWYPPNGCLSGLNTIRMTEAVRNYFRRF